MSDEIWLTKKELATALRRTTRTVEAMQVEPSFPETRREGRRKLYPLAAVIDWYVERTIEQRIGEGDGDTLDLTQERARLAKVQRQRQEVLLQADRERWRPSEEWERVWAHLVSNFRARCLAIPAKAAPAMAVTDNPAEAEHTLRQLIHEALRELAEHEPEDA